MRLIQERLKLVGRPPASLGRWRGPQVLLRAFDPSEEANRSRTLRFSTEVEARVVYDLPGAHREWERARSNNPLAIPVFAPGRILEAIIVGGDKLYLARARRR